MQITFTSLPSLQFGTCDVAVDNIDFKDCKAGQIANSTGNGRDTGVIGDGKDTDVNMLTLGEGLL